MTMTRSEYLSKARTFAARGEQLAQARLSEDKVRWIRRNPEGLTFRQMANRLGVHHRTVEKVRYGETWGHVE